MCSPSGLVSEQETGSALNLETVPILVLFDGDMEARPSAVVRSATISRAASNLREHRRPTAPWLSLRVIKPKRSRI